MSYSDVLRANADMFEKAKIMLELDKRNAYLERGLSNKQINNEMSKELIDNKIMRLMDEKKKLLEELTRDYNRNTKIMDAKYDDSDVNDTLLTNQQREIDRNEQKLLSIRNDILTLRRQIELSENDYRKKSFVIFFLKHIFMYLLTILLIGLLVKNKNIKNLQGLIAGGVVTGILVIVILYNLYMNKNRSNHIFDKHDFIVDESESSTKKGKAKSSFNFGISVSAGADVDAEKN